MRNALRKRCTIAGRWQRELNRQLVQFTLSDQPVAQSLITQAKQLVTQAHNKTQNNKLYSLHESDVDCISKGKACRRYEFGFKVGVVCTQNEQLVLGMHSYPLGLHNYPGNFYDSRTLYDLLQCAEAITQVEAKNVDVDPGYRAWHSDINAQIIHRKKSCANAKSNDCVDDQLLKQSSVI